MECCHGDEIDKQANKNGGNDFWHKHTRQCLKTSHLFMFIKLSMQMDTLFRVLHCIEQFWIRLNSLVNEKNFLP